MGIRTILVVAALLLSACGNAAPTSTAEATDTPDTPETPETPETPGATVASEPPSELALVDDDPLCAEIDGILDNLLTGNMGSASDYSDFEQQLPPELRGQVTTGPIPTVSVASRAEAAAVDAHTNERCGVPFVQSNIHVSITCEVVLPDGVVSQYFSDWGPCTDPRVAPDSVLPLDGQMDDLQVLEQAIAGRSN